MNDVYHVRVLLYDPKMLLLAQKQEMRLMAKS